MDFSISGSDSWETTAAQETFIESYFREPKFPAPVSGNAVNKRKHTQDVNLAGELKNCKKKKKSQKLPMQNPQPFEMDPIMSVSQLPSKKKLKKVTKALPMSKKESGKCTGADPEQCTQTKSSQKLLKSKRDLISSTENTSFKKKLKKVALQETESFPDQASPKKNKRKRLKESLKSNKDLKVVVNSYLDHTENESLQEPQSLSKHLVSPIKSKLKKTRKKKSKIQKKEEEKSLNESLESDKDQDAISGYFDSAENEVSQDPQNINNYATSPIKSNSMKTLKRKSKEKVKQTLGLQKSENNSEDVFQESDEELVAEIKNSNVFKEIKELIKQAPFLSSLKDSDDSFGELSAEDSDESLDELSAEDSDESLDELAAEDSDESLGELNIEDSDESAPGVVNSKTTKGTKNIVNTQPPVHENKNSNTKLKTSIAGDKKILDQVSTVGEGFIPPNKGKPLIQNLVNSKKSAVALSLKSKAQGKLQAAKFRYLNEKLYTETGASAFQYFQENEDEFHDYHQGYSLQVSKWPMNPVNKIISDLQGLKKSTIIADMGCGDAKIAQALNKMTVHSFDIVALNEFVTPCDISKVPLPNESVDVVVFCLSLMGTNLKEYLLEAHRVLKMGGALKIAEVESRITDVKVFIKGLECLGFALQRQDLKHKIFVFLDLKKKKRMKISKIPNITLRPCLYKKR